MELSILIAKIISAIYIAAGIALMMGSVDLNAAVEDLEKSPALRFIAGAVGIAVGMILVEYHNFWVKEWPVLISLIGWLFLIGGVIVVLAPKALSYSKNMLKNPCLLGLFMLLFGMVMGYFGFMV